MLPALVHLASLYERRLALSVLVLIALPAWERLRVLEHPWIAPFERQLVVWVSLALAVPRA
jgi:hypothetical protein